MKNYEPELKNPLITANINKAQVLLRGHIKIYRTMVEEGNGNPLQYSCLEDSILWTGESGRL